ncbi:TM2 domain-containing protein [Pseudonocardia thermophila]|uniref:TM2 domain-containing protein n=1 Tax=Pseudonocardia thermophila TaxID=1848 RepID=A0A1M6SXB0_PSETH|nr:TM2 domain-containing protein [Pseudonocardia thermophila]
MEALGEHFAQGRLDADEYGERSASAFAARTVGELEDLFHDLPPLPRPPHLGPPVPADRATVPPTHQPPTHQSGPDVWRRPPMVQRIAPPHPSQFAGPDAPYGREPGSGIPYSDKQKVVAGVLQLFLPFGVGRFYAGHAGLGIAQLLTTFFFGIGIFWSWIDGLVILTGRPTDPYGRPLR